MKIAETIITINGYKYTQTEVLEALRKKGYLILDWIWEYKDETFPGGIEIVKSPVKCALKGADLPSEKNIWTNVAIKEFQKEFVKPPLL